MKCRLKPVRNPEAIRTWCGPAAISILTGNRVAYAAGKLAMLKYGKNKPKMVKGCHNWEMRAILDRMGYELIWLPVEGITLGKWIDTYSSKYHRAICLVNVTDHYVVTHLGQVADNRVPNGCPISDHHSRRCKIQFAWIVTRRK